MEKYNILIISIVAIVAIASLTILMVSNNRNVGYAMQPSTYRGVYDSSYASSNPYVFSCDCASWLSVECHAPLTCKGCCKIAFDEAHEGMD